MVLVKSIKPKIFWVGPFVPLKNITCWKATSPAAVKWQTHLLEALVKKKIDIEWLYYRSESGWPKGKLLPSLVKIEEKKFLKRKQIHYLNFFGLKYLTKRIFLKKILLDKIKKNFNHPCVLISYNAPNWINKLFQDHKISSKFFCVYLLADDQPPSKANGYIFLSYGNYKKNFKLRNKLHLDGAVYPLTKNITFKKTLKNKKKIFLYSGSLHKYSGAETLIKAIKLIKKKNFELWITGPGEGKVFENEAKKDRRIKFFGLLEDNKLKKIYCNADIFLNPRPINLIDNEYNFPSKLFDYLSWKKPIISTWTKGLSPIYKKVLHISNDSPKDIAYCMMSYLQNAKKTKINNEFMKKKNWANEAKNLIIFLNKVIKK